ncbi:hypothetical protein GYB14_19200 [bacterium]|nr:hypothetical protein [bacterium]
MHPKEDEISVTFFGPGFGESIAIHVGDRNWIIIDSCLNDGKEPAALAYLTQIGVDISTEVKLIMATHWHDDHIKGLSKTLEACASSAFAMPISMCKREFLTFLYAYENQPKLALGRGGTEILNCMKQLKAREKKFVVQDKVVQVWDSETLSHGKRVELIAVSPSEKRVEDFLRAIGSFLDGIPERPSMTSPPKSRIHTSNKNDLSIATVLTIGDFALLFGADVEESGCADYGWSNIVTSRIGRVPKPHIYKVAHHGSIGAHHDDIWREILEDQPISVVTPWVLGGNFLPQDRDKARIKSLSGRTFVTSSERLSLKKRYERDRLKMIERSGVKVNGCIYRSGSVTFTIDPQSGKTTSEVLAGSAARI